MNELQSRLAGRALGTVGGGEAGTPNLAHRLESAVNSIAMDIFQIENTLSRIMGAPGSPVASENRATNAVQPTAPLALSVDRAQQCAQRIRELAASMDQVA